MGCQHHSIATKPKIVLALATGKPLKNGRPPQRVMRFAQQLSALMPGFEVVVSHSNCPREAHAVNLLIEEFRASPASMWFVLFDPEAQIAPHELKAILETGKPVIGALCAKCEFTPDWDASFYPDLKADDNGVLLLPELGATVKAFHRTVFDLIEKADPELTYIYDNTGRSVFAFCQEQLGVFGDYKRLLSPSASLDFLCRKANIGIFAHTKIRPARRGADDTMYPRKEPYHPWEFTRLPPPVCAEDLPEAGHDPRPIAVCLQYCDKDETLAREKWTDCVSPNFRFIYSAGIKYPKGPNDTALELMREDWTGFRAVLLLEPDCAVVTPEWLHALSLDWGRAAAAGKLIMGSWHPINADHPTMGHLNGNLMFAPDIASRIDIPDVPDDKPWDTFLAATFQPHWCRTGLIKNLNRHRTATTKQIETPECGTKPPVLIHGVKDNSVWNYATKSSSPATEKTSSG